VAGAGVGGQLAGAGQLQALDDRLQNKSTSEEEARKYRKTPSIPEGPMLWVGGDGSIAYRLASAVGADDEGERPEEGDDVPVVRVEAPDPFDQHLVHRAHLAPPLPFTSLLPPLLLGAPPPRPLRLVLFGATAAKPRLKTTPRNAPVGLTAPWMDGMEGGGKSLPRFLGGVWILPLFLLFGRV
jgi:hypothetical protein